MRQLLQTAGKIQNCSKENYKKLGSVIERLRALNLDKNNPNKKAADADVKAKL